MSFSGNLDDVTVIDLLQFIRIGGRTGTLLLNSGLQHAEISFHQGAIVSANGPGSLRLGELLLVAGVVDMDTLDAALERQASEQPRRTLGRILVDGGLPLERMHGAVRQQIEEVVRHVVSWQHGSFEFAPDELRPIAELGLNPGDGISALQLDTQSVLLEALQLLDESRRGHAEPAAPRIKPGLEPPQKPREPGQARIHVVTRDEAFVESLAQKLQGEHVTVTRVGLHEAGTAPPGEAPPLALLDLRAGAVALDAVSALCRTRRRAWVLAIVEEGPFATSVLQAGALAALPPDVDLWVTWLKSLLRGRDDDHEKGSNRRPELLRLRRIFEDLRTGLISTSISLSLMNAVSESVERCVLFVARPGALVALGAFGAGPAGRSLAQVAAGLRLDLSAHNAFTACLESGEPLIGSADESKLPPGFFQRLGRPRTGQFAVLPVLAGKRVMALVYIDNGVSDRALDDIDILGLASAQVGLAFENELLRREASRHS